MRGVLLVLFLTSGPLLAAPLTIVTPKDSAPEVCQAARELAEYWEKVTGDRATVETEEPGRTVRFQSYRFGPWQRLRQPDREGLVIYLGETRYGRGVMRLPEDLDPHGFRIRGAGEAISIRGGSPAGTLFGAYRFLHSLGVRWYMPNELGEHVPQREINRFPRIDRVEEPDYVSRKWYNVARFSEDDWERRNLVGGRDLFHHALHRIFTENVYEIRPDFFILRNGERIRPDDRRGGRNFQICFGNPDAAKFAARKAAEFFEANPDETSFSLGMMDTAQICECPLCQRWVDPANTFRDRPNYSDLVFTFMNRAAIELGRTHPDKFLGCLAYYWAEDVPSFPVHPKVMPYLTAERAQWQDPVFRREDRDLIRRWSQAGPERFGIYDYYYGASFVVPRAFNRIIGDSLAFAHDEGADGFFAEINSRWPLDGPKAWLASQLLWESDADPEALLDEFYANFFGEAADPMRAFYETAEKIWISQDEPAFWLKFYHDFTQLELFPPEVNRRLRAHLERAEQLAEDDRVQARVALVADGFRLTELYSELYHGVKAIAADPLATPEEVAAALDLAAAWRRTLERHYDEVILPNPLQRTPARFEDRAGFLPGMKLTPLLAQAGEWIATGEGGKELSSAVAAACASFPELQVSPAVEIGRRRGSGGRGVDRIRNGDFMLDAVVAAVDPENVLTPAYTPLGWSRWTSGDGEARVVLARRPDENDGGLDLAATGVHEEVLYQRVRVKPGELLLLDAEAKGVVRPGSRVEIRMDWYDANGEAIGRKFIDTDILLPGHHRDWVPLAVYAEAPPEAATARASIGVFYQAAGDTVFLDNIRLRAWGE